MRGTLPVIRASMVVAGLIVLACMIPRTWADNADLPVTLAVLEFALNLDISNPGEARRDRLPARLASESLLRLASESKRYALAGGSAGDADPACTDADCALRKGRDQQAQRVIWGQITKVSALIWFVSAYLMDVPTGTTLHAETLQFRGNMTDVVPRLTQILWRRMHEDK